MVSLFTKLTCRSLGLFGLGALLLLGRSALALDYVSPRSAGLAGSGVAAPLLNDALYLNPSFAAFLPAYSLSASYAPYSSGSDPNANGHWLNFSLADGRSELFSAIASYTRRDDARMIHLAGAKSIVPQLAVGLGAKFVFAERPGIENIRDLSLGASSPILPWLTLGLSIDNLIQNGDSRRLGMNRRYSLGGKANIMGLLLGYLDPVLTQNTPSGDQVGFHAGLELPLFRDLFLRSGYQSQVIHPLTQELSRGFGVGLGWIGPKLSLDYGLTRLAQPTKITAHHFGASIFF